MEELISRKNQFKFLFLILVLSLILGLSNLYKGHVWGDDHALFLLQAKSVIEGNMRGALIDNTYNIENSDHPVGPKLCTWGFPLLLSLIYYFLGLHIEAMKILCLVFFLMSLVVIFSIFKDKFENNEALLLVLIFAINPYLLEFNNFILSDLPYMFFSLYSIFLIDKFIFEKEFYVNEFFSHCLLGVSIFCAYFIRSNGFLLILTLLFCQLYKYRFLKDRLQIHPHITTIDFIPYIVFFLCFIYTNLIFPEGTISHLSFLKALTFKKFISNILYNIKLPAEFFGVKLRTIIFGATIPFIIFGLLINFRKYYHYIVYSFLTILVYIIWPEGAGMRYLFPILPFYIFFFFYGLLYTKFQTGILQHVLTYKVRVSLILALISFLFIQSSYAAIIRTIERRSGKIAYGHSTIHSKELFNYILKKTNESDVIIFFKPRVMNLLTGRKSIIIKNPINLSRGDYLVINKLDYLSCQVPDKLPRNNPERFQVVFENNHFKVYKIEK